MATYTFDLTTDTGKLRALVRDTNISGGADSTVFSDEELDMYLDLSEAQGNLLMAAAIALRSKALHVTPIAFETGDMSIDKRQVAKERRMLADRYEEMAKSSVAEYVDSINYEISKFGEDLTHYVNDEDY